jgi:hypothetical protein
MISSGGLFSGMDNAALIGGCIQFFISLFGLFVFHQKSLLYEQRIISSVFFERKQVSKEPPKPV